VLLTEVRVPDGRIVYSAVGLWDLVVQRAGGAAIRGAGIRAKLTQESPNRIFALACKLNVLAVRALVDLATCLALSSGR
jgi:hypothetical protein